MSARLALLFPVMTLLFGGCEGGGSVTSPVVRVDLRARLPEKLQRRLAVADTTYECRKLFKLGVRDAEQGFVASWRVLDEEGGRYVTAVEVEPDGPTRGGSSPSASASVLDVFNAAAKGQAVVAVAPLLVSWSARKGCSSVGASTRLDLRADDPGCRKPKPGKLLVPVR